MEIQPIPPSPTLAPPAAGAVQARKVAEAFESFFLSQVLAHMSTGLEVDGPFGGGSAEKTYRSLLNDEYAKAVAARGGIGIADIIHREILRLQEVAT